MGSADRIHIGLFHQSNIFNHGLFVDDMTCIFMVLMKINAL